MGTYDCARIRSRRPRHLTHTRVLHGFYVRPAKIYGRGYQVTHAFNQNIDTSSAISTPPTISIIHRDESQTRQLSALSCQNLQTRTLQTWWEKLGNLQ
jgi:hypothetical protein